MNALTRELIESARQSNAAFREVWGEDEAEGGHGRAKMSDDDVIRAMRAGRSLGDTARQFGVSRPAVFQRAKKLREAGLL